jgi:hypothetical protein
LHEGGGLEDGGSDEEEEEEETQNSSYTLQQMQLHAKMVTEENEEAEGSGDNSCHLLWQGIQSKRTFTGFKFQVFTLTFSYCLSFCCKIFLELLCFHF